MSARAAKASEERTGAKVLDALGELPGGVELLELGGEHEGVALVGGAVRDILMGATPRELDVVVARGAAQFANELSERLGPNAGASAVVHERFGTALVQWPLGRIDVAERRAESYPAPGALPQVRPGTIAEDLARRDFTINALAVALAGARAGELSHVENALEDLRAGRMRVLHERSFSEDPTRLLRLARYRARLGFAAEQRTAQLAAEALAAGALDTISRARIGAELRLALGETDALAALAALQELGVLVALHPLLRLDTGLARRALALLPPDGHPEALLASVLLLPLAAESAPAAETTMFELLDALEFSAGERERVIRTALAAPELATELSRAAKPSELHHVLAAHTSEAVALAGALGEGSPRTSAQAELWFERLRHVRLQIGGEDLLGAGIPAGPQIGRRLAHALALKLDGELHDDPASELAAALATETP